MRIIHDVKTLDSNVRVIAQQLTQIKRNERILARNLIALNKKLNEVKEKSGNGGVDPAKLQEIEDRLVHMREDIMKLQEDVEYLKQQLQKTLTSEDVAELKYIVETVNPLEFVTYKQVGELVEKKLKELGIIR
jgi:phage shock protein A